MQLWEILVPTIRNKDKDGNPGKPFRKRFHKVWDDKVKAISNGLTILTPVKGRWVSPRGELFDERMIPVRIIATQEQIEKIIDMTMKYYDQEAILAYRISDTVILKHRGG
jgi:hypothetical protein